jgi:hypothetical protein
MYENLTNLYGNDQKIGRRYGRLSGYFMFPVSGRNIRSIKSSIRLATRFKKGQIIWSDIRSIPTSVAETHHFYAAPAPVKNFDAAPATAPTLQCNKVKQT